ncbi:MAG TPA: DUF2071 domain-containing protein [Gemmatimonadales bacterium]|nr:DUF2071 domain-containing protein [Gemmatimonadales bacterium]
MTPRPFLTARWSNLVLLTFEAPEDLVRAQLAPGVEPDRWNGKTHASLVALEMHDVLVRGWRIPGFAAHPQVNFRVYARHGAQPAVAFVRELVPSRIIAAVGRLRYGEPFQAARISARLVEGTDSVTAEYRFGLDAPRDRIVVTGSRDRAVPAAATFEYYLTQRTYGVRTDRHGRPRAFRVEHVPWAVRRVVNVDYAVDFAALYGPEWEVLNHSTPVSTIFAVGSDVSVYPPEVERR